jgi:hypothetical protein
MMLPLSLLVVVHLGATLVLALAAKSGPWGDELAEAPRFIPPSVVASAARYLSALHLEDNFHYPSNRPATVEVWFEAVLYDKAGKEIGRRKYPQDGAWAPLRQRESMLAFALASDRPRLKEGTDIIQPAGEDPKKIPLWRSPNPDAKAEIVWVAEQELSRNPAAPDEGPTEWELAVARSFAKYLCRATGADTVEIIRHFLPAMPPLRSPYLILAPDLPADREFAERLSSYGKVSDATGTKQ